jgi:hypothetical protein
VVVKRRDPVDVTHTAIFFSRQVRRILRETHEYRNMVRTRDARLDLLVHDETRYHSTCRAENWSVAVHCAFFSAKLLARLHSRRQVVPFHSIPFHSIPLHHTTLHYMTRGATHGGRHGRLLPSERRRHDPIDPPDRSS